MSLDWTLEIHDKISAPSKAAAGALRVTEDALLGTGDAADKLTTKQDRLAASKARLAAASRANAAAAKAEAEALKATMAAHDAAVKKVHADDARTRSIASKLASDVKIGSLDAWLVGKNQGRGKFADGRSLGPAGGGPSAAARMLQGLEKILPGSIGAASKFADAWDRVGPILSKVAGPAALAASAILALGVAGVGAAASVAKFIYDATAFKGGIMFAFEKITGSKAEAQRAYDLAAKTSMEVGADFQDSMKSMNTLLAQGFKADFADQLLRAMADLKTLNPEANLSGITRAISQIKTTGHLQGDELMQLAEAGLNVQAVYEQIAKSQGITAKGGKSAVEQVQKLQAAGKISSDVAIAAIMASIKAQTGKEFGAVASEKADASLPGAIARAENLKDQLLAGTKVDWSPLSRSVKGLVTAMDSPSAKRFMDAVGTQLSRAIDALFGRFSASDFTAAFDAGTKAVTMLGDGIGYAWKIGGYLVDVARIIGPNFQAAGYAARPAFEVLSSSFATVKFAADAVSAAAKYIGDAVGSAIGPVNSLSAAFDRAAAAAGAVAGAARGIEGAAGGGIGGKAAAGAAAGALFGGFGGGLLAGKRAGGGPVDGGSAYLVGEHGPEIFAPHRGGRITSTEDIARALRAGEMLRGVVNNSSSVNNSRSGYIGQFIYQGGSGERGVEDALRRAVESWG